MYISSETPEETQQRLLNVIARARLKVYTSPYAFAEFRAEELHQKFDPDALAVIRDGDRWSQLIPCEDGSGERFRIFSFHFQEGLDNSGFVGWLASLMKQKLGTGIFVICGQNSNDGGIFDYWGCPYGIGDEALKEIRSLIKT